MLECHQHFCMFVLFSRGMHPFSSACDQSQLARKACQKYSRCEGKTRLTKNAALIPCICKWIHSVCWLFVHRFPHGLLIDASSVSPSTPQSQPATPLSWHALFPAPPPAIRFSLIASSTLTARTCSARCPSPSTHENWDAYR